MMTFCWLPPDRLRINAFCDGVLTRKDIAAANLTRVPNVFTELGNLSNPADAELLSGRTLNTHALTLAEHLAELGLPLVRDTTVPDDLAAAMTDAYVERRRVHDAGFDAADCHERASILGAQRNAKILGRFVEYAARTGRTHHLRFLPRVRRNLEKALDDKVLAGVQLWYERLGLAARP